MMIRINSVKRFTNNVTNIKNTVSYLCLTVMIRHSNLDLFSTHCGVNIHCLPIIDKFRRTDYNVVYFLIFRYTHNLLYSKCESDLTVTYIVC